MLNIIWICLLLGGVIVSLYQGIVLGNGEVYAAVIKASFDSAKTAFEIAIGLTGILCFWLGIMRIGEKAGFLDLLGRLFAPLFARIFPEVPKGHPALGSITMNLAANMLGLDNAATPIGLRAMRELQDLNKIKETASNSQIMFLVINASSVTILPITIFTYRAQLGAANPADVFLPILFATFCSTFVGFLFVATVQKIKMDRVLVGWMLGSIFMLLGLGAFLLRLSTDELTRWSSLVSNFLLLAIIAAFLGGAIWRRQNAYEIFVDGAKEGFTTAVTIIPYLVTMLVAIGIFRASGAMEFCLDGVKWLFTFLGFDTSWVAGLPTMLMKPLSGSGARAMMIETMKTFGADSFAGRLASIVQGSTETTFYILALYFGSVGVKKTRYAVAGGLIADIAGMIGSVFIAYLFFAR